MNRHHKQRVLFILIIIGSVMAATSLALYALQQNINLFYSPSQIVAGLAPVDHQIRLGGIVQRESLKHVANSLEVSFRVADQTHNIEVHYTGVLPDLFREGQSVVVEGKVNSQKILMADQVLAKHDERYMPAAVAAMFNKDKK